MIAALKRFARRLPYLRELHAYIRSLETERDELRAHLAHWKTWMSPGHFYSPIPNLEEIRAREGELFGEPPPSLPGIALREREQLALLNQLAVLYRDQPFPRTKGTTRYYFENGAYSYGDALFLHCMLRHLQPKRVIEVGSGYSSAVMLDTNELFLGGRAQLTFIDPDPTTLRSLLRPDDHVEFLQLRVQDVPLDRFDTLEAEDVLFIDSTHVAKTGSDVNRLLFDVLPRLKEGVYIHFHDVFYPFEYPKEWVYEGRAWNEDYILRAFLSYNGAFEIVLFANWLGQFQREWLEKEMPMVLENPGGSLWIRRSSRS